MFKKLMIHYSKRLFPSSWKERDFLICILNGLRLVFFFPPTHVLLMVIYLSGFRVGEGFVKEILSLILFILDQ